MSFLVNWVPSSPSIATTTVPRLAARSDQDRASLKSENALDGHFSFFSDQECRTPVYRNTLYTLRSPALDAELAEYKRLRTCSSFAFPLDHTNADQRARTTTVVLRSMAGLQCHQYGSAASWCSKARPSDH